MNNKKIFYNFPIHSCWVKILRIASQCFDGKTLRKKKEGLIRRNFQRLRRLSMASLHFIVKLNNKTMLKKRQSNLWELKIVFNVRDVSAIFHFATLKLKAQKESFSCENGEKDAQQCRLGAHSTHFMPQWLREYFQLSQQPKMTQTCFCTLHFSSLLRAAIKSMWIIWKSTYVYMRRVWRNFSSSHESHTQAKTHNNSWKVHSTFLPYQGSGPALTHKTLSTRRPTSTQCENCVQSHMESNEGAF